MMDHGDVIPGRVLVVDDQEHICWVLDKLLSERGHVVHSARSGGAALAALARFDCQVAVVDYRLPDVDGCSLIQELTLRTPGLRSILMTSYGSASLCEMVRQGRVFAYFDKPFKNSAIVLAVESAIISSHAGADSLCREPTPRNGFPFS